jgi:hypothetical protein
VPKVFNIPKKVGRIGFSYSSSTLYILSITESYDQISIFLY